MIAFLAVLALAAPALAATSITPSLRGLATTGPSRGVSSLTLEVPAAALEGDVLLAVIDARLGSRAHVSAPSGWKLIRRDSRGGKAGVTQATYARVLASNGPATYTWGFPARVAAAGAILAYADVDPDHPVDVSTGRTGAGTSLSAPSLTTKVDASLLVALFVASGRTGFAPGDGFARRYEMRSAGLSSAAADAVQKSAGPTGSAHAWLGRVRFPTIAQLIALRPAPVEAGDLRLFDSVTSAPRASSWVHSVTDRVYAGKRAAYAHTAGGSGIVRYARGILNLRLTSGAEIWYSAAFFLPYGFYSSQQGQVDLMRWDNWTVDPRRTDRGGLVIFGSDHQARLMAGRLGSSGEQRVLAGPFTVSEGRWHWLEVHQRFSAGNENDLSEVYLDGQLQGSTTAKNWYGRPITRLRFGLVATDDGQSRPLDLWFDSASLTPYRLGPATSRTAPGR